MQRIVYYVTASVDGFIAEEDGGIDWLQGAPEEDYGYAEFYAGIDSILLGRATYEQTLGFDGPFPYLDKPVYVFSMRADLPRAGENVQIVSELPERFVARLKLQGEGRIWLGGGGRLAGTLLDAGLVDEVDLFVQPVVLGGGIGLFGDGPNRRHLEPAGTKTWPGGLIELRYTVAKGWRTDDELGL